MLQHDIHGTRLILWPNMFLQYGRSLALYTIIVNFTRNVNFMVTMHSITIH